MRIGAISFCFPPSVGGQENHMVWLYQEMTKMGHSVFMLTEKVKNRPSRKIYKGIQVDRAKELDIYWLERQKTISSKKTREKVENAIRVWAEKTRPDILHAHNLHYFFPYHAVACEKISKELKIPLVLTAHCVWPKESISINLIRKIEWTRIIAISKYVKSTLIKIGFPGKKIDVVYNGIPGNFKPRKKRELKLLYRRYPCLIDKKIILHPARISITKGQKYSVLAIKKIIKELPDSILVLTGAKTKTGGSYPKQVLKMIKKFKLSNHIIVGNFSNKEMSLLYSAADVIIYPRSRVKTDEGFGYVTLEAGLSSKPVIVARSGALPELIKNGFNGYVIPKGDSNALAKMCIKLIKNPKLAKRIGKNCRKWAKNFTVRNMARNTLHAYKKALRTVKNEAIKK